MLGDRATPAFKDFFVRFCRAAHVFDTIPDAWADYCRGEIAIRPGALFHLRLQVQSAIRLPLLFIRFPEPLQLLFYAANLLNASRRPN
jgi:hypothetical protein